MIKDIIERLDRVLVVLDNRIVWPIRDAIAEIESMRIEILRIYHDMNEMMIIKRDQELLAQKEHGGPDIVTYDPVRDAAPAMLAALKLLMGMYNDQSRVEISHGVAPVEPLWVGTVRDAIAKAERR